MLFAGIDPGKEGAIAWMDGARSQIEIADAPLLEDGSYDLIAVHELVRCVCREGKAQVCVRIEDTISVPHAAHGERFLPASDKWLHYSLGMWQMAFAAFKVQTRVVHPRTWKEAIFSGIANSDAAEEMAILRRFPSRGLESKLRGPKGGRRPGRVDAVAICEHGRCTWNFHATEHNA
jgi:hypothetical protein